MLNYWATVLFLMLLLILALLGFVLNWCVKCTYNLSSGFDFFPLCLLILYSLFIACFFLQINLQVWFLKCYAFSHFTSSLLTQHTASLSDLRSNLFKRLFINSLIYLFWTVNSSAILQQDLHWCWKLTPNLCHTCYIFFYEPYSSQLCFLNLLCFKLNLY